MKWAPHGYQARAVNHVLKHPSCALYLDMGLGKTAIMLIAIRHLLRTSQVKRVLVVGPLRVVTTSWPDEIAKWDQVQGLEYSLLRGTPSQRERATRSPALVHLINYEALPWLVALFGTRWPYDMVVLDESSKMKSHATKRFKALRKMRPYMNRVVELTGTPAPQGLHDLWSQTYLLDGGERLGKTVSAFRQRWFRMEPWGYAWNPTPWAEDEIHTHLADICLSMSADDYLKLPPFIENTIPVHLPATVMDDYAELEKEMYVELLAGGQIEAVNAAVKSAKCHQMANGQVYDSEHEWHAVHAAKMDVLEDVIEEASGSPVIVAYTFQSDLERLLTRFTKGEVLGKDPNTVTRWNRGEIQLLFVHPATAGHGLNLQAGGHTLVWYGLTWSLEHYLQLNKRLHRQGQLHPVMVHHLVAADTVDEAIMLRLIEKCSVQDALLRKMRSGVAATV